MQHLPSGEDDDEDLPDLPPGQVDNEGGDDEDDEDLPPLPVSHRLPACDPRTAYVSRARAHTSH